MAGKTVRSQRLAGLLAGYRKNAGLGQREVAAYAGRTVQWLSRTENAATCRPSVGDVRALLALYNVTDPAEVGRAVRLATEVRQPGWWHEYDLSASHATFVALESEAAGKRIWSDSIIPGLLQTPEYARAVIVAGPDEMPPDRAEELVRVRMERKKLLHRPAPLRLHAITDEAALHRGVGGPEVMAGQLRHLAGVAQEPNVRFQVLPAGAGAHPGMGGSFAILEYPDPSDHDVVYSETPVAGGVYAEEPEDIGRAYRAFSMLAAMALPPGESLALIRAAAGD